jgi:hypothetical protein
MVGNWQNVVYAPYTRREIYYSVGGTDGSHYLMYIIKF